MLTVTRFISVVEDLAVKWGMVICEIGRTFGPRLDEHKKEVETITTRRLTREMIKMLDKRRIQIGNNKCGQT